MQLRCFLIANLLLLLSVTAFAQSYTIKGVVKDTVNFNALPNASVTLIHAKDSVLETFTRTKEDGTFSLDVSQPGKYIMLTVFPGFVDFVDNVEVKEGSRVTDLGEIPMMSRTHLLQEFVYTDQFAAIKIKGDTIEYVADSFKVRENANVEELLKKLPGLQVDKDGNIQAHGQKVEKLLVDGEEFFTDASQSGLDQNDSEILGQTEMELIKKEVLLAGGNYNELMKRLKSGLSYDELVKKGYISALDRVLADEYSYTARDGEVLGKKEDLQGYKNNRNILSAANLSDQSVRVLARNVAVETGTIHYTGRNSGKPFDLRKRYTTTWIRRDGCWQIVADHTSKIEH